MAGAELAGRPGLWYHRPMETLFVIGGGLAGCEAALQAAEAGVQVRLIEMKPARMSPAHHDPRLAELVCSNSLRNDQPSSAVGLLKLELEIMGSRLMAAARQSAVPAGKALAVDRGRFAELVDQQVRNHPRIELIGQEAVAPPEDAPCILASGPLTDGALAQWLAQRAGAAHLHFYDAIAPIVTRESVDMDHAFWGDRWAEPGQGDYLNCPLDRQQWAAFYAALTAAENVALHDFESPRFFEGCLPIEVMAARGEQTLLFGPMKPVGLHRPGQPGRFHAVVQLRKEDAEGRLLNMVGFQTKLTHQSQLRVFRLIPALAHAEFARLGSIHRNSFVDAPRVLDVFMRLRAAPNVFVAGQLAGVEGYVESMAAGLLCGLNAARLLKGQQPLRPPATTALGGLLAHLANDQTKDFQPSNVNFGLLPPLGGKKIPKKDRGALLARRAMQDLLAWLGDQGLTPAKAAPPL